jgi:hypothetical protein
MYFMIEMNIYNARFEEENELSKAEKWPILLY